VRSQVVPTLAIPSKSTTYAQIAEQERRQHEPRSRTLSQLAALVSMCRTSLNESSEEPVTGAVSCYCLGSTVCKIRSCYSGAGRNPLKLADFHMRQTLVPWRGRN
jgi:hypothetical protein